MIRNKVFYVPEFSRILKSGFWLHSPVFKKYIWTQGAKKISIEQIFSGILFCPPNSIIFRHFSYYFSGTKQVQDRTTVLEIQVHHFVGLALHMCLMCRTIAPQPIRRRG